MYVWAHRPQAERISLIVNQSVIAIYPPVTLQFTQNKPPCINFISGKDIFIMNNYVANLLSLILFSRNIIFESIIDKCCSLLYSALCVAAIPFSCHIIGDIEVWMTTCSNNTSTVAHYYHILL